MVRFIEVNKNFRSLEAIITLLPAYIIEWAAKFQLEVKENKVLFPHPSSQNPWNLSMAPKGSEDPRLINPGLSRI